jgi:hypothetical protein
VGVGVGCVGDSDQSLSKTPFKSLDFNDHKTQTQTPSASSASASAAAAASSAGEEAGAVADWVFECDVTSAKHRAELLRVHQIEVTALPYVV